MSKRLLWVFFLSSLFSPVPAAAIEDLASLSLEQLSDLEVLSVSKTPQKFLQAPAAIFVITQDDIRRSGVTTIPEALRLAPGVEVARINASQWSIGIRGFGSRLSRAVLVLIDGRSVYSPLFAGTYWEAQDYVMGDIERIEVIRGPGGTLWGANAVNGVINITTKNAKQTQGGRISAGGGSEEKAFGSVRYGARVGEDFYYRLYGKGFSRDSVFHPDHNNFDDWTGGQAGFRTDWDAGPQDTLTVQSDVYKSKAGQRTALGRYTPPFTQTVERDADIFGTNLLGRWKRTFDSKSDMAFQWYYDRTQRTDPTFQEHRDTVDFDFQHRFPLPARNQITWGLGYRLTTNGTESVPTLDFDPSGRTDHLASGFIQDEWAIVQNRLSLTLGSKLEHNDYSGWEAQPSAHAAWTPTETQTVWAGVSRAVRTPSQIETDLNITTILRPAATEFARLSGNPEFDSEELLSYELGYRAQPWQPFFIDVAAFYNVYDNLLSLEGPGTPFPEATPPPPHTIVPFAFGNMLEGETHGGELASSLQVLSWWRLRAQYSLLLMHIRPKTGSLDATTAANAENTSPRHQALMESSMDLPYRLEWTPLVRYVDHLGNTIHAYWELDMRLGWQATPRLELALVGQNLIQPHHAEFTTLQQPQRGVYGKATWTW